MKLGDYELLIENNPIEKRTTLLHKAPEAFTERELKSDVWSFGITMYELAKGKNPFEYVKWYNVEAVVCGNDPPSLSSEKWSADFVDFVSKCLVKDVKERPSVDELMNVSDGNSD